MVYELPANSVLINNFIIVETKEFYLKNIEEKKSLLIELANNIRCRTSTAFKSQRVKKQNKIFDLLGCTYSFFQRRIISQLYEEMTLYNYGSLWEIDHCYPLSKTNLPDNTDMIKVTNWVNLRPVYKNEKIWKGSNVNHRFYLLQQVKAKYLLKLNNQEGQNEDFHQSNI